MDPGRRERIGEVLAEALQMAAAGREAFVRRASAGDSEIQAEALSLLDAAASAGAFMDRPTGPDGGRRAGARAGEGPGAVIGRYILEEQIGEGGFGTVFMAEQREPVRRKVAFKIIKLGMDTTQVIQRFEAERQALAVMDHPHIAKVLDAGATDTGRPYFVMELVAGEPITAYCDQGNLTITQRLNLFDQVCRAVQHAHTKGIIHRDLKPSNVLVSTQDGEAMARVIDFGIAKATSGAPWAHSVLTEAAQLVGTPQYMSPEQARGSPDIDTRTDVYSLGVLLYELLTGSTPFDPRRMRSGGLLELQRMILEDEPPRPSTRLSQETDTLPGVAACRRVEPARLGAIVRGELDWIVMKALEKDRARRYETPSDLGADVRRYAAGEAVSAAPPSAGYRLRKFVRRNRAIVLGGALVGTALVVGMVGTSWGLVRANAARADERVQRQIADKQAAIALAANRFLSDMLAKANRGEQGGNPDVRVRDVLDAAAADLASGRTAYEPEVHTAVLDTIGKTYQGLGLYDEAGLHLREALRLRRQRADPDHLEIATSLVNLAGLLHDKHDIAEAEPLALEALAIRRTLLRPDDPAIAQALATQANLLRARDELDGAESLYTEALAIWARRPGEDLSNLASAQNNLALVLQSKGAYDRAEPMYESVLALYRQIHGPEHPQVAAALNNLASLCQITRRYPLAEGFYNQALEMRARLLGPEHPSVIVTMNNLAWLQQESGNLDGAAIQFRRVLDLRRKVLGEDSPDTISSLGNLAGLLQDKGEFAEAESLYRQCLERRRRILGPDHPQVADCLANLATLKRDVNDLDAAESLMREAVAIRRKTSGGNHPTTATALLSLAAVLHAKQDLDGAEPLIREALAIQRGLMGDDHAEIARTLGNLGTLLQSRGDQEGAEAVLREALPGLQKYFGPDHARTAAAAATLGAALAELAWTGRAQGDPALTAKAAEGEALLRDCLALRERTLKPTDPVLAATRGMVGVAIIAAEAVGRPGPSGSAPPEPTAARLGEAELLLANAYDTLTTAAASAPGGLNESRLRKVVEGFVRLYTLWDELEPANGKAHKAAEWRTR